MPYRRTSPAPRARPAPGTTSGPIAKAAPTTREPQIVLEGIVAESLRNASFRVTTDNGHEVLAYNSGKMRMHRIRVLPGDRVQVEVSPYDLKRGRITYRFK